MLEHAEDCHGQRQRPWRMACMVVLQKKKSDVELAHGPVLDDEFPQDGTIVIFIVAVM